MLVKCIQEKRPEWFALVYCAISLGMRESELFGLLRKRVDLESGRVQVIEQCGPLEDGKTLGQVPLKTKSSKRTLYLDAGSIRALEEHWDRYPSVTLAFPNPRDPKNYILKRTMSATVFPSLLRAADLPTDGRIWFHLLRHVASSLLSSANLSTPKIDKWMGHTTSGIAGKYIQANDADLEEIAGVMERLLEPVWATKKSISGVTSGVTKRKQRA